MNGDLIKMSVATITQNNKSAYGAFELKRLYPRNYATGLLFAIFLHLLGIGLYYFVQSIQEEEEISAPTVRIMKYSDLGPPPSIANDQPPQIAVSGPVAKPTAGIPIPVPDAEAPPEQEFASQEDLSAFDGPGLGDEMGTGVEITQDIKIEADKAPIVDQDPDMDKFIPVEKMPEIIKTVKPLYPDLAVRAGLEGKVFVKILVDKEGKPKKAVVVKSDAVVFNESAVNAAMQYLFTPALQNNKPVIVWVVVPFRYELK